MRFDICFLDFSVGAFVPKEPGLVADLPPALLHGENQDSLGTALLGGSMFVSGRGKSPSPWRDGMRQCELHPCKELGSSRGGDM